MRLLGFVLIQVTLMAFFPHFANGQNSPCYKQLEDASGYDASAFLNTLEPKACELRSEFPGSLPPEFRVYDFGYYQHTAKYQGDFQSDLLNSTEFRDSITTEYYLIIAKTTTAQGVYSGYEVLLNLPGVAPFDSLTSTDITAIARLVKLEIESIHAPGGGVTYSEAGIGAGLDLLAVIIESIVDRTFSLTEMQMLALNDFFEVPIGDASVTHSGIPTIDEAGFFDYAGLVSNDDGALLKDAIFASWELEQGEMNYVITDSENLDGFQGGQFNAAHSKFKDAGSYYVFWYHFILPDAGSGDPLRLFVKTRTNLTEEQALNLLYNKYLESKSTSQNAAIGSDDNTAEMRMSPSDTCGTGSCKMEASWIKNCLLPKYASVRTDLLEYLDIPDVGVDYVDFKVGVLAGVYDGIFDILILLIDGGKFLYEGAQDNIFQSDTWKNKSRWGKALELGKIVALGPIAGPAYIFYGDEMADAYQAIKGLIDSEGFGALLKPILEELNTFFTDLSFQNGTICAGYAAGIIVFEVATSILTGGTSQFKTVFKLTYKSMKESLQAAGSAAGKAIAQIGNNPGKFLKCRVLMQGCFVAGTPVLMANNKYNISFGNTAKGLALAVAMPIVPVPIQDVQLLDYAVAHKTVNAGYGITASTSDDIYLGLLDKDPYTSDQQRERDKYELNDTDWNEVVFEEVHGTSMCKLAIHQDWIHRNAYVIDGVVNLNLPEQGIEGPFRITSIKHIIPQKKPVDEDPDDDYDYKPVTALFVHQSDAVYNITFNGDEAIGVTYQHPIFSVAAGDWRLAGELEIGEKVLTKSGESTVSASEKKGGSELVFNLEVKDLHNFLVGNDGVVVHNNCLKTIAKAGDRTKIRKAIKSASGEVDEIVEELIEELAEEGVGQAIKKGRQLALPELKALWKRGNDFNAKGVAKHSYSKCEIHLGNGKRLDTYIPGQKIISRKATNLDDITESTWKKYCNELVTKYKKGTPVNSSKMPGEPPLSGKYYLEIPASNKSASKLADYLSIAKGYGIEDIIFLVE